MISCLFMKYATLLLAVAFITGCAAAPPPVRIASHLIERNVLHKAKDRLTDSDDNTADTNDTDDTQAADRN